MDKGSCDCHVTVSLARAHLALGDIQAAEMVNLRSHHLHHDILFPLCVMQVVQSFMDSADSDTDTANMLQVRYTPYMCM